MAKKARDRMALVQTNLRAVREERTATATQNAKTALQTSKDGIVRSPPTSQKTGSTGRLARRKPALASDCRLRTNWVHGIRDPGNPKNATRYGRSGPCQRREDCGNARLGM